MSIPFFIEFEKAIYSKDYQIQSNLPPPGSILIPRQAYIIICTAGKKGLPPRDIKMDLENKINEGRDSLFCKIRKSFAAKVFVYGIGICLACALCCNSYAEDTLPLNLKAVADDSAKEEYEESFKKFSYKKLEYGVYIVGRLAEVSVEFSILGADRYNATMEISFIGISRILPVYYRYKSIGMIKDRYLYPKTFKRSTNTFGIKSKTVIQFSDKEIIYTRDNKSTVIEDTRNITDPLAACLNFLFGNLGEIKPGAEYTISAISHAKKTQSMFRVGDGDGENYLVNVILDRKIIAEDLLEGTRSEVYLSKDTYVPERIIIEGVPIFGEVTIRHKK